MPLPSFKLKDLQLQLKSFKLNDFTPPARKIVLLPDTQFFIRAVSVAAGATPEEVSTQVELALEGLAPFPLTQMAFACYWTPGSTTALVYAAYRKRFSIEQTDNWQDAEVCVPTFVTLLNAQVHAFSTIILTTNTFITAINWGESGDVPASVTSRPLPPEPTDADRAAVREELTRNFDSTRFIEVNGAPVLEPESLNGEYLFTAGSISSLFLREQLDTLDIRDKEVLVGLREARKRDLIMWRSFVGCLIAVAACLVGEVGLLGLSQWNRARERTVERQQPSVDKIRNEHMVATRIEELSTKRLQPFRMIGLAAAKRPDDSSILFRTVRTNEQDKDVLEIDGVCTNISLLSPFEEQLKTLGSVRLNTVGGNFTVWIKFKPELLSAPGT